MNKFKSLPLSVKFSVDFPSIRGFVSTRPYGNARLPDVRKTIAVDCDVDYADFSKFARNWLADTSP